MKFAAIDIGSNAVRLLIADIIETPDNLNITKLSLVRVPLRLGASVFDSGKISGSKTKKLIKTIKAFRYLIDVYEVRDWRACATSAMREAENSTEVLDRVKQFTGVNIEIINGQSEANLIFSTFKTQKLDPTRTYLYIDVGGGSTEITLLKNAKRVRARSFKIGTVRMLKQKVTTKAWREMTSWVEEITAGEQNIIAIGTGGNINRLFKMSGLGHGELMPLSQLQALHTSIAELTLEERILKFRLRPDRADVIVPAGEIFLNVLTAASIDRISVPKIGLSDGIALHLFQLHTSTQKEAMKKKAEVE